MYLCNHALNYAWVARRVAQVWSSQYRAAETERIPPMERLMAWLPEALPADDLTTLVHGDLRVDNMIFSQPGAGEGSRGRAVAEPEVRAVLDWELSTLGHPGARQSPITDTLAARTAIHDPHDAHAAR